MRKHTSGGNRARAVSRWFTAGLLSVTLFIGSNTPALAATPPKDGGAVTDQSALLINLAPGKRATLKIAVQNTGKTTWYKNGTQRTGLNTLFPLNSASVLATPSWLAPWRPVRMTELTVKPGETAHFVFPIQAPKKPGVYYETMQVGHSVTNLVPGTDFRFVVTSGQKLSLADFLRGRLLDPNVTAAADPEKVTLSFKNTGRWRWLAVGNTAVHVQAENAGLIPTDGWVSPTTPAALSSAVKPGGTATFTFRLKHPTVGGSYAPTFRLFAGSTPVEGTAVTIPFTVGGDGTIAEPNIRVGLFTTTTPTTVSTSTNVSITNGVGTVLGTLPAGVVLTETYDGTTDTHTAKFGSATLTTQGALRLVGPNIGTVQTITSFSQPSYNGQNDNTFRGTLEFRFASPTGRLWVINELPLDTYLLGLAEGSNGMPPEYLKTLATAARSYALWHILRGTKHANENYTLNATTDQAYRGEGMERRAVDPVAATRTTYGQVILHAGATFPGNPYGVALAPYSACTDGRTRSFSEKFGGNQADWPWLVSVPDSNGICTNQTYLAGGGGNHMVGMSANGARYQAETGGRTFDQILRYYYTGVTVGKLY